MEIVLVLFYEIGYNYLLGGFEEFVLDLFYEIGYNYLLGGFDEIVLDLLGGFYRWNVGRSAPEGRCPPPLGEE